MGQQQLLLIILSVIIVGIALAVGITIFSANAIEQKRNILIDELAHLASHAQLYYRKPREYGGGGNSFTGWTVPEQYKHTEVGSVTETVTPNQVILTGIGNEIVTGSDSIEVQVTVLSNTIQTAIIH